MHWKKKMHGTWLLVVKWVRLLTMAFVFLKKKLKSYNLWYTIWFFCSTYSVSCCVKRLTKGGIWWKRRKLMALFWLEVVLWWVKYMASCVTPVIHVWGYQVYYLCRTGVLNIYMLYMYYTCIIHICTHVRPYICITCVKHVYTMYYKCFTHVLQVYELHV